MSSNEENNINNGSNRFGEVRQEMADRLIADIIKERIHERRWKLTKRVFFSFTMAMGILVWANMYYKGFGYTNMPTNPTIAVVPIVGGIAMGEKASADAVNPLLKNLFENESVEGIVLHIRSGGGSPTESERIIATINRYKKMTGKKIIAVCDGLCASAAYMIAVHADEVIASNYSMVGSIGAIMKGFDFSKVLEEVGVDQHVFASSQKKDMFNSYKKMLPEQEEKLQSLVDSGALRFKNEVIAAREGKLTTEIDLFTGEVWMGEDALKYGLVDKLDTIENTIALNWPDTKYKTFFPKVKKASTLAEIVSEVTDPLLESFNNKTIEFTYE
jgi:protease IV